MIKIPGTEEGVSAIEDATADGINVNVTLLFKVESYEAIAEAYVRGMERRLEAGQSLDVHSVASFFVSLGHRLVPDREAREAADDDVLAGRRRDRGTQLLDRLAVVLVRVDVLLLEQHDLLEPLLHPALGDLLLDRLPPCAAWYSEMASQATAIFFV